jgi:hypothetical protein
MTAKKTAKKHTTPVRNPSGGERPTEPWASYFMDQRAASDAIKAYLSGKRSLTVGDLIGTREVVDVTDKTVTLKGRDGYTETEYFAMYAPGGARNPVRNPSPEEHLRLAKEDFREASDIFHAVERGEAPFNRDMQKRLDALFDAFAFACGAHTHAEGTTRDKEGNWAHLMGEIGELKFRIRYMLEQAIGQRAAAAAGPVSNPRHGGAHYFVVYDGKGKVRAYTQTAQEAREESARYKGGSYKHL